MGQSYVRANFCLILFMKYSFFVPSEVFKPSFKQQQIIPHHDLQLSFCEIEISFDSSYVHQF